MIPIHLAAARVMAANKRAYLAPSLYALTPVERKGLDTVACDKKWRLHYDTAAISTWSIEELAGVLIHEVSHLLRDHAGRSKEISAEHKLFNRAADMEINSGMRAEGLKLPEEALYPESMNLPDGKLAEEYYRMLKQQLEQAKQDQEQSEDESEGSGGSSSADDDSLDEPSNGGSKDEDSSGSDSSTDPTENSSQSLDEVEEEIEEESNDDSSDEESEDGDGSSSQGDRSLSGSSNRESSDDGSNDPQSLGDSTGDGSQGSDESGDNDSDNLNDASSDEDGSGNSKSVGECTGDDQGTDSVEASGDESDDPSSPKSSAESESSDEEESDEDCSRNGDSQQPFSGKPGAGHCGSCATGMPEWYEEDAEREYPGLSGFEADKIRKQTARRILEASKSRGDVPEGWRRWAEEITSPKIDWRRELRALVRHALIDMGGAVDYSYRRPSRRQSAIPKVVLPSLRNPIPSIAVIIDTSGSISDEMLSQILAEIEGILLANGKREGIHVIACDAEVHWKGKVFKKAQVQALGGGGTDLRVGIAEALKLKPRPQVMITVTDGYTPWPERAPRGTKMVVALLEENAEIPKWAKVVKIDKAA